MVNPQPDEKIIDPACGTGGFLIIAMNHALEFISREQQERWHDPRNPTEQEYEENWRARQEYLSQNVYGLDLNPSLVRAAKMNMVMNNDGSGSLWQANSLANPHSWNLGGPKVNLGTFNALVTNPPFGTNIRIDDQEILAQYELARIWDSEPDSNEWTARQNSKGDFCFRGLNRLRFYLLNDLCSCWLTAAGWRSFYPMGF